MRKEARDYSNCIPVMIPVPEDKHLAVKLFCVKNNITMKELFYDILMEGIDKKCNE